MYAISKEEKKITLYSYRLNTLKVNSVNQVPHLSLNNKPMVG